MQAGDAVTIEVVGPVRAPSALARRLYQLTNADVTHTFITRKIHEEESNKNYGHNSLLYFFFIINTATTTMKTKISNTVRLLLVSSQ